MLVPVYNREALVSQTIDSVLAQTFTDYELIVIDDGSTDKTFDVLRAYGSKIKILRHKNSGPEVARFNGAAIAQGEYFAMLDSDDLFLPSTLATYDRIIRSFDPPPPVIIGNLRYFRDSQTIDQNEEGDRPIEILHYRDFLSKDVGIGLSSSSLVVRRAEFESEKSVGVFPFDTLDMVLRVGNCGPCVLVRRPHTVCYRVHDTNTVHNLEYNIKGLLSLIQLERMGEYPGGWARIFSRYSIIGGHVAYWAKKAIMRQNVGLAIKLLVIGFPMVAANVANKTWHMLHTSAKYILLQN